MNMKTTKSAARECYDSFRGTLRCFNGGTHEENVKMAPHCLRHLRVDAELASKLSANPSKVLAADAWLMEALTVTIPDGVAFFEAKYFPPSNVIPFTNTVT